MHPSIHPSIRCWYVRSSTRPSTHSSIYHPVHPSTLICCVFGSAWTWSSRTRERWSTKATYPCRSTRACTSRKTCRPGHSKVSLHNIFNIICTSLFNEAFNTFFINNYEYPNFFRNKSQMSTTKDRSETDHVSGINIYDWVRSWCDRSSDRSFMVDPLSYFSFQPVFHDWCNKGRVMCYPVYEMVHIKYFLLLIGKSGPLPYVQRHITVNKMCWVHR